MCVYVCMYMYGTSISPSTYTCPITYTPTTYTFYLPPIATLPILPTLPVLPIILTLPTLLTLLGVFAEQLCAGRVGHHERTGQTQYHTSGPVGPAATALNNDPKGPCPMGVRTTTHQGGTGSSTGGSSTGGSSTGSSGTGGGGGSQIYSVARPLERYSYHHHHHQEEEEKYVSSRMLFYC